MNPRTLVGMEPLRIHPIHRSRYDEPRRRINWERVFAWIFLPLLTWLAVVTAALSLM